MRPCHSRYLDIRGLRYHVRRWAGSAVEPVRLVLHGWMDVSATWQRVVDHMPETWTLYGPDWRGFGLSGWGGDTYWFADYVADLDALLHELSPDAPVDLIAHSMGSQVAALYAGARPDRVRKLVAVDGFYVPEMPPEQSSARLRSWLNDLPKTPRDKTYDSLEQLAHRVAHNHPRLDAVGAAQVADAWGEVLPDGRVRLRADPRHRQHGPLLYRSEEAKAVFGQVTAPVLCIDARDSNLLGLVGETERDARIACFSDCQRMTIDGGHMLHFDAPETLAAAIHAFLKEA